MCHVQARKISFSTRKPPDDGPRRISCPHSPSDGQCYLLNRIVGMRFVPQRHQFATGLAILLSNAKKAFARFPISPLNASGWFIPFLSALSGGFIVPGSGVSISNCTMLFSSRLRRTTVSGAIVWEICPKTNLMWCFAPAGGDIGEYRMGNGE